MKSRLKLNSCFLFMLILSLIISTMPVMAFAETAEQWVTKASMSTPRKYFKTAVIDGKIYVIGGANNYYILPIEEYNPALDKWTTLSALHYGRDSFQTVVVDGEIFAIGGFQSSVTAEKFNPKTNKWADISSMSEGRKDFCAEVVDGKIYVMGGRDVTNDYYSLSSVEQYDPKTDKWTKEASMSTPRTQFQTKVINGKIYAIGGKTNQGSETAPLNSVERYDPETNKWTTISQMSDGRYDFQTVVINGKIYAIGGNINTVEEYNAETNKWTKKAAMSTPRVKFQTEIINGNIYAIGSDNSNSAERFDPIANKWTTISSMSTIRSDFQTAAVNNKIYAIGGSVEEYTPVSSQPDTPTTLTAAAGDKQVSLSWSPVTGAAGYNIYRSTTSGGSYSKIATGVTTTTYTDTGLTNGVTYYYYVKAVDSSGMEGQPSNEASATPTASSSGGYNATLRITMVTGETKEYNVTSTVVEKFINWFNSKGSESPVFTFEKTSDLGPYTSHTEYLAYDKISSFKVLKY